MARVRVHFSKTGYACFISHIDLPMLFGRAARRAGLRPELTQGFSPHPRLALCPPLPIGVVGLREPADFWFEDWSDDSLGRWQSCLPWGIEILAARVIADGVSLHKLCPAAAYTIEPLRGAAPERMAEVLAASLGEADALLCVDCKGNEVYISATDLERCGPSRMVKVLIASSLIEGWADVAVARTAVGRWDESVRRVISLMEDSER